MINLLKHLIKKIISRVVCFLLPKSNDAFNKKIIKNILVLGCSGIGNMILHTPFLQKLRKTFPDASISIVHTNLTQSYRVLDHASFFDKLIVLNNLFDKISYLMQIKSMRFDLIFSTFHNCSIYEVVMIALSRAPYRVGHVDGNGWKNDWSDIYNFQVTLKDEHETSLYFDLLEVLGINIKIEDYKLYIGVGPEERKKAEKYLVRSELDNKTVYIAVQVDVSQRQPWKAWPDESLQELIIRLNSYPNVKVILLGERCSDKIRNAFIEGHTIDLIGKTSISEAAAIIGLCDTIICCDSGLMHVASAMGIPIVALFGPTDLVRTAPLGKHFIVRSELDCIPCYRTSGYNVTSTCHKSYKCMSAITVDQVFSAVFQIIDAATEMVD